MICATLENQTSYITLHPSMTTVSNSAEQAGQMQKRYPDFQHQTPKDIYTWYIM